MKKIIITAAALGLISSNSMAYTLDEVDSTVVIDGVLSALPNLGLTIENFTLNIEANQQCEEPEEGSCPAEECPAEECPAGKPNINTATIQDLTDLQGIGDVKAHAVIEYREYVGRIYSFEEMRDIPELSDLNLLRMCEAFTTATEE